MVWVCYTNNCEELWMKKFAKFKTNFAKWEARDLTLKGKMLFINSYVVSGLNFMSETYIQTMYQKK